MTFPYDCFVIADVVLKNRVVNYVSESKSLIKSTRRIPGQRWEWLVKSIKLDEDRYRPAQAFIDSLEGRYGVFELIVPRYSQPKGVASGSPSVLTSALAGVRTIQATGFTPSVQKQLKCGDFFKFANHSKVYRVIEQDVNSNASGQLTLKFFPQLVRDVPATTALIVRDVPFTVRQSTDVTEYSSSAKGARKITLELDLEEAL
jgi:hypothetical protein